jgi:predicted membrane-bound dolichyl-phosphate-mannose-protein mannosyltransferase
MEMREKFRRFYRWEYFWLLVLVLATLAMHFAIITNPGDLIFDEQHYVRDARNIIQNHETERTEHPPLAKLFIVAGIKIFGDNPWGWRFFSVIFGTITIVLFYFLCRRLEMSRTAASIAVFLLALENLTFVQASVAMLDVYFLTFMVAAFLLYACRRYINAGVAIGLSTLAKLNGALAGPAVFIHWVFTRQGRSRWFLLTVVFAVVAFLGLMVVFDSTITRDFSHPSNPFLRIQQMEQLSSSLTFSSVKHTALSRPWTWVIEYQPMAYWYTPHYTGGISFTIWALIIPAFGYMIYRAIKGSDAALFGLSWFAGTYLIWIPVSLLTNRVSFIYYFYPSIGAICLGVGLGLAQLLDIFQERPSGKLKWTVFSIVVLILFLHLVSFIILSPLVPVDFAKMVGITPKG